MRKRNLLAAAVVVLVACSEGDQVPTSPAGDVSFAAGDNGLHGKPEPHVFLRKGFARKPSGSVNMTFHGGTVLPTAKVRAIFWGSPWGTNTTFTADKITGLDNFFGHFGGSNFAGTNTEYSGTNGQVTKAMTYLGHTVDASAPPTRALTVSQAVAEACKITNNAPDAAGVYFLYTSTTAGHVNYCAWHSWGNCSNGAPVQVAYMPNIDGIGGCDPGSPSSLGHSQGLAALANVTAHELSEAITDPRGGGWYDSSGGENGDKCAWVFPSIVTLGSGSSWQAQGNWSNAHFTAGTGYANLRGQMGCINGNQ
jgi:hypothetical protein